MKKNKMMRLASFLLIAVLLSTSVISGTFAKYTTYDEDSTSARVAKWGFEATANSIVLDDLFDDVYTHTSNGDTVKTGNGDELVAPGTTSFVTFKFEYDTTSNGISAPEVAYNFTVKATTNLTQDQYALLDGNLNFTWTLTGPAGSDHASGTSFQKFDDLLAAISALDGTEGTNGKRYEANTLPGKFYGSPINGDAEWTITWNWAFDDAQSYAGGMNQDQYDTAMGNADVLDKLQITISVEATQID